MKKILAVLLLGLLGLEAKIIGQGELADYGLVFADGNAVDKDGNIKAVGKNFMVTGTFSDGLCVVFIGEQTFFMDENGRMERDRQKRRYRFKAKFGPPGNFYGRLGARKI